MALEPLEDRIAPATFAVTTLKDITNVTHSTGSLRDAIFNANNAAGADTILFQHTVHGKTVALTGKITLASDLPSITAALTITGPVADKANGLTIDGHKHQIFNLVNGTNAAFDATFTDVTITHGQAANGGGFYINDASGNIQIHDCVISSNHVTSKTASAVTRGGGVDLSKGILTILNSKVTGNFVAGSASQSSAAAGNAYGGGIATTDTLIIQNSVISGNVVTGGNASLLASTVNERSGGYAYGGGIDLHGGGSLTLTNSTVSKNKVIGGHGVAGTKGTPGSVGATGQSGGVGGKGGAGGYGGGAVGGGIACFDSTANISACTISKNLAKSASGSAGGAGGKGGAGGAASATLHAGAGGNGGSGGSGGNAGLANGAGIGSEGGTVAVSISTISGNTAMSGKAGGGGHGGAAGHGKYVANHVQHHGVSGAHGGSGYGNLGYGGGVYQIGESQNSSLTLSQVTIAKNSAPTGGGVDFNFGTGIISNCTIAQNKCSVLGGGVYSGPLSSMTVISTIVAGNKAPTDGDVSGKINASFDLIEHVSAGTQFGTDTNNLKNQNPLLGALGMHGGTTATMLPSSTPAHLSPVIDKGSNPDSLLLDQRGDPRVLGSAIDVGAVEVA